MTKQLQRRVDKLERPPGSTWPLVYFIEAPMDMRLETALEMLKCEPLPHEPVIYLAILPVGERPRYGADHSPITDAEWETLKDSYPRKAGWWNNWNGLGAEQGVALARAEAKAEAENSRGEGLSRD